MAQNFLYHALCGRGLLSHSWFQLRVPVLDQNLEIQGERDAFCQMAGRMPDPFKTSICPDLGGLMADEGKVPCSAELNITAIALRKLPH